jgi:hypothetical protein
VAKILRLIVLLLSCVGPLIRKLYRQATRKNVVIHESFVAPCENDGGPRGSFVVQCFDSLGNLKWSEANHNQIKNAGLDYALNTCFHGSAAITTWYIGLITAGGTITTAGDTMSSHAGWTESTAYSDATRREWTEGASSGGVITSSSTSDFNINATATIGGIFVTSDNTKSGTTGTLWSTAAFATDQSVSSGDVLKVSYTITMTAGAT